MFSAAKRVLTCGDASAAFIATLSFWTRMMMYRGLRQWPCRDARLQRRKIALT